MIQTYHHQTSENCLSCNYHHSRFFCGLPENILIRFEEITQPGFYPQSATLFSEAQTPRGVYVLCSGRARFSISSRNGKSLMRIVEPGEILGLSATITGSPYEGSAEMLESGRVSFIRREDFLRFLSQHGEAGLRVAQHLSSDYYSVHDQVRSLALSDSVAEKLARLLLGWCERNGKENGHGVYLKISLTHGEIGQMIGTSRETVTRLFSEFRNKGIIQLKGSSLFICNKAALESLVSI